MSHDTDDRRSVAILSIVVVSYNTKQITLECLRSIREQTTIPYELVVIDNASPDGSAEAIAKEFPDLRLIAATTNHGFAKANNIAVAETTGDLVLLLNPDTLVLDRAVDRIVTFARTHPSARIWGGRTLFPNGELNPSSCWRRMSLWTLLCRTTGMDRLLSDSPMFNAEAYGGWKRDTEREVDVVSGCFFLIERSLWDELGGFDLTYVMYGEEVDLCHRAQAFHARPRITPNAEIVHYGGASESVRSGKLGRLLAAKATLVKRHLPFWQQAPALTVLRAWPLSRLVAARVLSSLTPGSSWRGTHEVWREVWSERGDWWNGYPLVEETRNPRGGRTELRPEGR